MELFIFLQLDTFKHSVLFESLLSNLSNFAFLLMFSLVISSRVSGMKIKQYHNVHSVQKRF